MISRPSVRLAAVLLICYLCIALPRSCYAEQQPSLRGSVSGTALGDAQDFNNVTLLDSQTLRRRDAQETNNTVFIAGLFNTSTYDWTEIFNFTMKLIQERNGWHDDILGDDNNTRLEWAMADSACDEDTALQAYWDLTTSHVVHGVVGTRCSDDSILIARITGLESTPQISPSATSPTLSDKTEFPYFSRLVAATESEALVATLRRFGWSRVSIIGSDTQFASDQIHAFSRLWVGKHSDKSGTWTGEIAYQHSVTIDTSGGEMDRRVVADSVHQALAGVPTHDPTINSRVILLIAHDNHAFEILRIASESRFQPDSIWVGLPSWCGRVPQDDSFIPRHPGYIGISQFRNRNSHYQHFLKILNAARDRSPYVDLPDYTAEYLVDSIVAMTMALARTPQDQRRDGAKVSSMLRSLELDGVSGPVRFNEVGDRDDAKYSILNLQYNEKGQLEWVNVGTTGIAVGSAVLQQEDLCFAEFGCDLETIPSDTYPVKPEVWVAVVMCLLACLLVVVVGLYWRTQRKRTLLKEKTKRMAKQLEQQMQGMVEIVGDLPVTSPVAYQEKVEGSLGRTNVAVWYWEEDPSYINSHNSSMVLSGSNFVGYSREVSGQLEHAFQLWKEKKGFANFRVDLTGKVTSSTTNNKVNSSHTGSHYEVNFEEPLSQKNSNSNHRRKVRREEVTLPNDAAATALPPLPRDIEFCGDEAEHLLPVFSGQIIQVSKAHPGNEWLYGTVLYDPVLEEALKQSQAAGLGGLGAVLANALHDRPTTGWFPKILSETADVNAMTTLLDNLGSEGAGALKPPSTWDEGQDGCVLVPSGSKEYDEVADFFMSALYGQRTKVRVTKIERLQNVPLWQSYALKKQSMKTRDSKNPGHRVNNQDASSIERKWLFHGTTTEIVPKIVQQGFNRAFAGRNAVAYGKGVYFARDASYSSHRAYSAPDNKEIQRMFLCRVAVGDWCKGIEGQLTPDSKPHNTFDLFDCTVDNDKNPSIFVVYHDAQAYPEYLVSFVSSYLTHL